MVCGFLYFQMFVGMVCHKPCTKVSCYSVFIILTVTCYSETEGSSDELLSLLLKPQQLVLYHIVGLYCVYNILWIFRTLLTSCIHTYMVKDIWVPVNGEECMCIREVGRMCCGCTARWLNSTAVVGHLTCTLSRICSLFLHNYT